MAFRLAGETITWGEVADDARRRGEWEELEREVQEGIASHAAARSHGRGLPSKEVRALAAGFRHQRSLLAAEDLEAWLEARDIGLDGWMAWIGRELARRKWPDPATVAAASAAPSESLMWVTGVCSGALTRWGQELAGRAAVQHALAEQGTDLGRDDAYDVFCLRAASQEAIEAAVSTRYLDWTVVDCQWSWFTDRDVAREALLCARDDGEPLIAVGAAAGASSTHRRLLVEDVEPELRYRFLQAQAGHVVGPFSEDGGFAVVAVLHKMPPHVADAQVRRRAEEVVTARAIGREVEDRVRWVDRL